MSGVIKVEVVRPFLVRGTVYSPAGKIFYLPVADAVSAVESGRARLVDPADRRQIVEQVEADTRAALQAVRQPR